MLLLRGSATFKCCSQSLPLTAAAAVMEKTHLQLLLIGKQLLAAHGS
jgi:hypothetical protein